MLRFVVNALFGERRSNTEYVAIDMLATLKVRVTEETICRTLKSHPDFGSLLGIADAFKVWGIETMAVQVTEENLEKCPVPFITSIDVKGPKFIVVKNIKSGRISYSTDNGVTRSFDIKRQFLSQWSGSVLLVDSSNKLDEHNYPSKRREEILNHSGPFSLYLLFSVLLMAGISRSVTLENWPFYLSIFLLKIAGVAASTMLVMNSFGSGSKLAKALCSLGKQTNCFAVLNSPQGKIFNLVSWSEVGFIYFAGCILTMIFAESAGAIISFLWLTTSSSLPYVLFSVFYQWRIVKKWCILCLTVQAIFLIELSILWINAKGLPAAISLEGWHLVGLSFAIPTAGWLFIRPFLALKKRYSTLEDELFEIKRSRDTFQWKLTQRPSVDPEQKDLGVISLGSSAPHLTLRIVNNPFCSYGAVAHVEIEQILRLTESIRVEIVLLVTEREDHISVIVAHHFLSVFLEHGQQAARQALLQWFASPDKDYFKWAKSYPVNFQPDLTKEILISQRDWCKENKIFATPTVLINGIRMPKDYQLADVKFILADL